jgi:hypothetical protein
MKIDIPTHLIILCGVCASCAAFHFLGAWFFIGSFFLFLGSLLVFLLNLIIREMRGELEP